MISGLHHYALEVPDLAVAEILQKALGHCQVRYYQRVVVQP